MTVFLSDNSPITNSRLISIPTSKKKTVIRASLIQSAILRCKWKSVFFQPILVFQNAIYSVPLLELANVMENRVKIMRRMPPIC